MCFDHLGHLGIFIQMTGLKMSSQPVGELRLVNDSYLIECRHVLIQMHWKQLSHDPFCLNMDVVGIVRLLWSHLAFLKKKKSCQSKCLSFCSSVTIIQCCLLYSARTNVPATPFCVRHIYLLYRMSRGLDSGPTMLTALLVQQLYGLPITTLGKKPHLRPTFTLGLMCQIVLWREHNAGYEQCVNILYSSFTSISMFLSNLHTIAPSPLSVSLVRRIWLHDTLVRHLNPFSGWPHTPISFPLFIELHAALLILQNQRGIGLKHYETLPTFLTAVFVPLSLLCCILPSSSLHFSLSSKPRHTHTTLSGHTWAYTTLVLVNFPFYCCIGRGGGVGQFFQTYVATLWPS